MRESEINGVIKEESKREEMRKQSLRTHEKILSKEICERKNSRNRGA